MKADKTKMFPVPLTRLKPESSVPFPLYAFLRQNNRMVPLMGEGSVFEKDLYERLLREKHNELWVPKEFESILRPFLEYLEKAESGEPDRPFTDPKGEAQAREKTSAAIDQVKSLPEGEENPLTSLGQELLKSLESPEATDTDQLASGMKGTVDRVLEEAGALDPIYLETLALRSIQNPSDHAVFVGSLGGVMALAAGFTDPRWIGDLVIAATFHDVGLIKTSALSKLRGKKDWREAERRDYESHVIKGVLMLQDSQASFSENVLRMVREHHERCDGEGFPNRLREADLFSGSKILMLANQLDHLCAGRETGQKLTPPEAVSWIKKAGAAEGISLSLVEKIFPSARSSNGQQAS